MHTSSCTSGACGCSEPQAATPPVARIDGVALHAPSETLAPDLLRQRACTELLRQQAQREGLLADDDAPGLDGATSEAATAAIEALLERALKVPEPSEDACRRYHAAHPSFGGQGARAHLRHVLFAVTPGVPVQRLTQRAEALLMELRCADEGGPAFGEAARRWSNCPSGAQGGDLGWLTPEDCAPEFAREIFDSQEVGVLSRLVHSRFGLHVVQVCGRDAAQPTAFDDVRASIARVLRQQSWVNAMRQYLQVLAAEAEIEGVQLDAAASPLVQ